MTNFEKIKNMSVEEMAEFIGGDDVEDTLLNAACSSEYCKHFRDDGLCLAEGDNTCVPAVKKWLESEVK